MQRVSGVQVTQWCVLPFASKECRSHFTLHIHILFWEILVVLVCLIFFVVWFFVCLFLVVVVQDRALLEEKNVFTQVTMSEHTVLEYVFLRRSLHSFGSSHH